MQSIKDMDEEALLSEEVLIEVFEEEDQIKRARLLLSLTDQAEHLKIKTKFEKLVNAYKQVERESKRRDHQRQVSTLESWTNFEGDYDNMFCGGWQADESGVRAMSAGGLEEVACYHPILPVERLKNLETGEEQIRIAYKRNRKWDEITVPKTMISSANKIVSLSGRGIAVTSENARLLVKYLADVENGNDDYINVQYSTSKLGWHGDEFIPYDSDIVFDGDTRF